MIQLIDQSRPASSDPNALVPCTYRCDQCGQVYQALTRARAVDMHKCGVPAAPGGDDDVTTLRQQVADLAALVAKLSGAPAPIELSNGDTPKPKRGRPKKAKAVEPSVA